MATGVVEGWQNFEIKKIKGENVDSTKTTTNIAFRKYVLKKELCIVISKETSLNLYLYTAKSQPKASGSFFSPYVDFKNTLTCSSLT